MSPDILDGADLATVASKKLDFQSGQKNQLPQQIFMLQSFFPLWNPHSLVPVLETLAILEAEGLKVMPDNPVLIEPLLRSVVNKGRHVAGAVFSLTQFTPPEKIQSLGIFIGLAESAIVDMPDSAGDTLGIRGFDDGGRLHYPGTQLFNQNLAVVPSLSRSEYDPVMRYIGAIYERGYFSLASILKDIENPSSIEVLRFLAQKSIENYASCVQIMHIQDAEERGNKAREFAIEKAAQYDNWAQHPSIAYQMEGSPLRAFGILAHAVNHPNVNADDLRIVAEYYRYVGVMHVLLDDAEDLEEDRSAGDVNMTLLFDESSEGENILLNLEKEFEDDDFDAESSTRSIRFAHLLTKAHRTHAARLEHDYPEIDWTLHKQVLFDLARFYSLRFKYSKVDPESTSYKIITTVEKGL